MGSCSVMPSKPWNCVASGSSVCVAVIINRILSEISIITTTCWLWRLFWNMAWFYPLRNGTPLSTPNYFVGKTESCGRGSGRFLLSCISILPPKIWDMSVANVLFINEINGGNCPFGLILLLYLVLSREIFGLNVALVSTFGQNIPLEPNIYVSSPKNGCWTYTCFRPNIRKRFEFPVSWYLNCISASGWWLCSCFLCFESTYTYIGVLMCV